MVVSIEDTIGTFCRNVIYSLDRLMTVVMILDAYWKRYLGCMLSMEGLWWGSVNWCGVVRCCRLV